MSRPSRLLSCLAIALLAAASAVAADAGRFGFASPAKMKADVPVEIAADSFSASSNGWVVAEGNVLVRQSDAQVTADRIRVNKDTGDIIAEGNVVLIREGQGATRTERLAYNYKTGEGITPSRPSGSATAPTSFMTSRSPHAPTTSRASTTA